MKKTIIKIHKCLICNNSISGNGFGSHLKHKHQLTYKEYYDKYFKNKNEGKCLICGKETRWKSEHGKYAEYCSNGCNYKSKKVREKYKRTSLEKWGVEYPAQNKIILKKMQDTCMKRYGVKNQNSLKQIKDKKEQTCLKKHGTRNVIQNLEIYKQRERGLRAYKDYILPSGKKIRIQGYEPQFLDYVFQNNLLSEEEIQSEPFRISYQYKNKDTYYIPDFYIPKYNLIVEIKSSYILQKDLKLKYKKRACISQGYKYNLIIDNKFDNFTKQIMELKNAV